MMTSLREKSIKERTLEVIEYAKELYGYLPPIDITFVDKGLALGRAERDVYGKYTLQFSRQVLSQDPKLCYEVVIPHEVAHIVCMCLYNSGNHDKRWKRICLALGGNGEATCSAPIIMEPKRLHKYYKYKFPSGTVVWLSSRRHNKVQADIVSQFKHTKTGERLNKLHFTGVVGTKLDAITEYRVDKDGYE